MQSSISSGRVFSQDSYSYLLTQVEQAMLASVGCTSASEGNLSQEVSVAAAYHLNAGGQRVRTKLALHAGIAAGLNTSDAITIAATVELLHNASLVHDDIEDGDELRRGQQAVWARFGVNTAICTGDLLLSAAYATLCKLKNGRALAPMISLVHQRVATAIAGQCSDLQANTAPSVDRASALDHYQQIATAKSGALLSLPLELVLLAADQRGYLSDARFAAEAFAIGYQIVDDLSDVQNDLCVNPTESTYNIVSIFKENGSLRHAIEQSKQLGCEKLDLAIALAKRLPFEMGEPLANYARKLRSVLVVFNAEA